ncbi:MAG: hypothetical protein V4511_15605 [Bacteroidota bacterium]
MKKIIRIISVVFLFQSFTSCVGQNNSNRKDDNFEFHKKELEKKHKKFVDSLTTTLENDTSINLITASSGIDRSAYLQKYLDTLHLDLKNNNVTSFLYDECLDLKKASYSFFNSEVRASLRYDIVQRLEIKDIEKLLKLGDISRLNKICSAQGCGELPYTQKSTLLLFQERLKKLESPR